MGYADEPWWIFLGHYKTTFSCWKLQFVWPSQQKEPDWHPQPLSLCLWWSVPQHNSVPATRSKASRGQWASWDGDAHPDPLTCWMGKELLICAWGCLRTLVLARCEQHLHCSLLGLENVCRKALLISISIYLNWNHSWSRSSSAWLRCLYKLS